MKRRNLTRTRIKLKINGLCKTEEREVQIQGIFAAIFSKVDKFININQFLP